MARKTIAEETLERTRRIETRITTLSIGLGIDTPSQKPTYAPGRPGTVTLPSIDSTIKAILACLPPDGVGEVNLMIGSDLVGSFTPQR